MSKTRPVIELHNLGDVLRDHPNMYNRIAVDLSVARVAEPFRTSGDFLYVLAMSSSAAASICFNDSNGDPVELRRGSRFQIPFHSFLLTHAAQPGLTLTLLIGKDLAFDFSELGVVEVSSVTSPVLRRAAALQNGAVIAVGAAATAILAARPGSRLSGTLINEGPNPCRLGAVGVTFAAGGLYLPVGAAYTHESCAALYGICNTGLATSVSILDCYES